MQQETFTIAAAPQIILSDAGGTNTYQPGVGQTNLSSADFSVTDDVGSGNPWQVSVVADPNDAGLVDLNVTGTIPEPGSLGLLGVASLGLLRRRNGRPGMRLRCVPN